MRLGQQSKPVQNLTELQSQWSQIQNLATHLSDKVLSCSFGVGIPSNQVGSHETHGLIYHNTRQHFTHIYDEGCPSIV